MPTHTPAAQPTTPIPGRVDRVGQPTDNQSPETLRLYRGDWTAFAAWCRAHNLPCLPAEPATLATYLTAQAAQTSRPTLARRKAAIAAMHRAQGLPVPTLDRAALAALRAACRNGPAPKRLTPRPTPAALRRLARRCPGDLAGLRDRALLLLAAATAPGAFDAPGASEAFDAAELSGASGAFDAPRNPGLVPGAPGVFSVPSPGSDPGPGSGPGPGVPVSCLLLLDAEHVRFETNAVILTLRSRTDDEKPSRVVPVPRTTIDCPVRALEDWLRGSNTRFGPVFRKVDRWGHAEHARLGPDALRRIVRARTRAPGPDPGSGPRTGETKRGA